MVRRSLVYLCGWVTALDSKTPSEYDELCEIADGKISWNDPSLRQDD